MIRIALAWVIGTAGFAMLRTAVYAPTEARMVDPMTPGEIVLLTFIGACLLASTVCLVWDGLNRIWKR